MAVLDQIRPVIRNKQVGETHVLDLKVEIRADSQGEQALFFTLVLGDPPQGRDSWPLDDLRALRGALRKALSEVDPPLPWYLSFEPEHPDLDDEQMRLEV